MKASDPQRSFNSWIALNLGFNKNKLNKTLDYW